MKTDKNREVIVHLYDEVTSVRLKNFRKSSDKRVYAPKQIPCLKSFYQFFTNVYNIVADYKFNLYSLIVNSDRVMASYYITGFQKKDSLVLNSVEDNIIISGIDMFRLDDGNIVEYKNIAHQLKVRSQTGLDRDAKMVGSITG